MAIAFISLLTLNPFKNDVQTFSERLNNFVSKSQELTKTYQDEIGNWKMKIHDNLTMASITDVYLPRFEELVNKAKNLTVPKGYENIKSSFIQSLESEINSYKHFKNYLISGNKSEDQTSIDYLSLAYQYEKVYSDFLSKNH